jgi:hypothetical protein
MAVDAVEECPQRAHVQCYIAWSHAFIRCPSLKGLDVVGSEVGDGDRIMFLQESFESINGCNPVLMGAGFAQVLCVAYLLPQSVDQCFTILIPIIKNLAEIAVYPEFNLSS